LPKPQAKDSPVVARNYVIDKYLPAKLKQPEEFLP